MLILFGISGFCPHIQTTWWPFPNPFYSVLSINRSACQRKPLFVKSPEMVALLCILRMWQFCAFLCPFTCFVVECVQAARKGFETGLRMATKLLLLMGRNLEETSGRMISNRNPHSRHTSAGPWGDLSICSKVSMGKHEAALRRMRLLSYPISSLAL